MPCSLAAISPLSSLRPSAVSSTSRASCFPGWILKKKATTGPRLVILVHRPEEALPVAAVLVVRGGWTERGTPLHPATRGAPTEGLLAEERLASRDHRWLDTGFLWQHTERRDRGQQLRTDRRWTPDTGKGRAEASGELLMRRWEHRREAGQWTGRVDGLRWDFCGFRGILMNIASNLNVIRNDDRVLRDN